MFCWRSVNDGAWLPCSDDLIVSKTGIAVPNPVLFNAIADVDNLAVRKKESPLAAGFIQEGILILLESSTYTSPPALCSESKTGG